MKSLKTISSLFLAGALVFFIYKVISVGKIERSKSVIRFNLPSDTLDLGKLKSDSLYPLSIPFSVMDVHKRIELNIAATCGCTMIDGKSVITFDQDGKDTLQVVLNTFGKKDYFTSQIILSIPAQQLAETLTLKGYAY
jgi:hypothetical protein